MTVRKDNERGTWIAVVYYNGKHYWRRGFRTKREAIKAELEIKAGLQTPKKRMKLDELESDFLAHQKLRYSMTTVKTNESRYNTHIKPYLGNKYIDNISVKDIQSLINTLKMSKKEYKNSYINHIIECISKLYNYAMDMEYIDYNPTKKVRKLKESQSGIKYITLNQFQTLYQSVDDFYYKTFLIILFYTGIRVGEARAIRWEQIDFKSNKMKINAHIVDKGGTRRVDGRKNNKDYTIIMPFNVKEALLNIYNIEKNKDGFNDDKYVFGYYKSWSYNKIRTRFKKALKDAGLEDIKLHTLRHSYASLLANSGASIQELAGALGDTLEVTINTYSHMYDDVNEKISNRINAIISEGDSSFFIDERENKSNQKE